VGDIAVPKRDYQCGLKRGERYRIIGMHQHDRITATSLHAMIERNKIPC